MYTIHPETVPDSLLRMPCLIIFLELGNILQDKGSRFMVKNKAET